MTILAWVLVALAMTLQLMNVVLVLHRVAGRDVSQLLLVPCVLWYVALVIRGEAFFFASKGLEIGVVVLAHLFLSAAVPMMAVVLIRHMKRAAGWFPR